MTEDTDGEGPADRILSLIEERIDPEHLARVDERYRRAFAYEEVDSPPLVVRPRFPGTLELPAPWNGIPRHDYRESFDEPAAMLVNQLLERVVPGVLLKDDSPLAIRSDHGTILVASALGCRWRMHGDDYPAATAAFSLAELEKIAEARRPTPILESGIVPRCVAALRHYREKLDARPACRASVQVSVPDLQGPFDTAEMLWGSDIYYALYDAPELLERLLAFVADTMLALREAIHPYTRDRLAPIGVTQHGYVVPGNLLIRDDSSILIPPEMYARYVRRHDARVIDAVQGGSIHFCGDGRHLVAPMLEIPGLRGLDFGDSRLMDIDGIYRICAERRVALCNVNPPREDLVSGRAVRRFPTGVVFIYETNSFEDALDVVRGYRGV